MSEPTVGAIGSDLESLGAGAALMVALKSIQLGVFTSPGAGARDFRLNLAG